jgi:hypothetical protein
MGTDAPWKNILWIDLAGFGCFGVLFADFTWIDPSCVLYFGGLLAEIRNPKSIFSKGVRTIFRLDVAVSGIDGRTERTKKSMLNFQFPQKT